MTSNGKKEHIAVLGAGLTGLSATFYLSRRYPDTKISLIERQRRGGGVVSSSRVPLGGDYGSALLEAGPSAFRPYATAIMEITNFLGLKDKIVTCPADSPGATNNFVYSPELGLQIIPAGLRDMFTSKLTGIIIPAALKEAFIPRNRPDGIADESFDSLLTRRFGPNLARMLGSAFIHGIYTGDSRELSVRAAFGMLWDAETLKGSVIRGIIGGPKPPPPTEVYDVGPVGEALQKAGMWTFKDGLQTFTNAIEDHLRKQPNVELLYDSPIKQIDDGFKVRLENGKTVEPTHIVSALPTPVLHKLMPQNKGFAGFAALAANKPLSLHIVNLVFPGPPSAIHPDGFGYFIPRPAEGYTPAATARTGSFAGVLFDTSMFPGQDTAVADPYNNAPFTKVYLKMGGAFALPPLPAQMKSAPGAPTPAYITTALGVLSTQLGRALPAPLYWQVSLKEDCIPINTPGHVDRIKEMKEWADEKYKGRLQIIGAGVGGVATGDCVEQGRQVAKTLQL